MNFWNAIARMFSLRTFSVVGILTVLVYGVILVFFGDDPHAHSRMERELFIWPALIALTGLYWLGYQNVKADARISTAMVAVFGLFIGLMAVLITPFHSTDIFGYINRGWQQVAYHTNPYVTVIDQLPGWENDPMITNHWVDNPCPYGFLYAFIAKSLTSVMQGHLGNLAATVFLFKGFNLLVHLGITLLVWLGARQLNVQRPELPVFLYLWNPLMILQHLSNGHNDIVMVFFMVLAAFCAVRQWWVAVIPALVAATLVKYAAVVLLPFALVYAIRQTGWRSAIESCLIGAVLLIFFGLPYLPDMASFQISAITENAAISHSSLHSVFFNLYKNISRDVEWLYEWREPVKATLKYLILAVFSGFYLVQLGLAMKKDWTGVHFIRQSLLVMLALVCFASLKFYPWYLGMFFPLAFFLPQHYVPRQFVIVLSVFQLYAFTLVGQAHILNYLVLTALPFWFCFSALKNNTAPTSSGNRYSYQASPVV